MKNNFEWKITELPSQDNDIHNLVLLMNSYGKFPIPFNLIAERAKKKIIKKLAMVDKINFNYDFFMLYGNMIGSDIWMTNTYILDYAPIVFGKHITIGPDVKLITSWHKTENFNIVKAEPITLSDNVWLPMNIIILPGVEIGENSIIGAGSIVTKSIPANSLAAGNPAKVIKSIDRGYNWWDELHENIVAINKSTPQNGLRKKNRVLGIMQYFYKEVTKQIGLLK